VTGELNKAVLPLVGGRTYFIQGGKYHPDHYDEVVWSHRNRRTKWLVADMLRWLADGRIYDKREQCTTNKCNGLVELMWSADEQTCEFKCKRCKTVIKTGER